MKTKHLFKVGALGLFCVVVGLSWNWALLKAAFATITFAGMPANPRLNAEGWVSFSIGCLGAALMVGAGIADAVGKIKPPNQTQEPTLSSGVAQL